MFYYQHATSFEPIADIHINIDELKTRCLNHQKDVFQVYCIGKLHKEIYHIPIRSNKLCVFRICPLCPKEFEEVEEDVSEPILAHYFKRITEQEMNSQLKNVVRNAQKRNAIEAKLDEENFSNFLKMWPYVLGFIIILLLLKFYFKLF